MSLYRHSRDHFLKQNHCDLRSLTVFNFILLKIISLSDNSCWEKSALVIVLKNINFKKYKYVVKNVRYKYYQHTSIIIPCCKNIFDVGVTRNGIEKYKLLKRVVNWSTNI